MASHFSFEAIGTHWQIDIYEALSSEQESVLLSLVRERIELFEQTYSRFRPTSMIRTIGVQKGEHVLPDDAEQLLSVYKELYDVTGGLFTPFMGQVLTDAGYDETYSLQQQRELSAPPAWNDVIDYRHPVLTVKQAIAFDFGAAGKGYLIDIVATLLEAQAVHQFCIDAGGDILHRNSQPLRVGLEDPSDSTKVIGVVELMNKSLCGSAGNRRRWQKFHHIINPKALTSPSDIIAVWVIADTTLMADALATCLFFVQHSMLDSYDFEYVLIRNDYSVERSAGFESAIL